MFAHFARDMGEDFVLVIQFDFKHRARQNRCDRPFEFDMLFAHSVFNLEKQRAAR